MKQSSISIESTGYFSIFFTDYISQNPKVTPFYTVFPTTENLGELAFKRAYDDSQRNVLVNVLKKQYADIENNNKVLSNIHLLLNPSCFTITTGHQLNIATGPMYVILKLITTINASRELSEKYPTIDVVPIYWMATEDHDFEEINHFNLFGKTHTWNTEQNGAVGRFELESLTKMFPELTEVPRLIEKCYSKGLSLTQATRKFVHALFGEYGLVCLDADDKDLKKIFLPIIKDELLHSNAEQFVLETNQKLKSLEYKIQVNPRNINLFYLDGFIRERIEIQNDKYVVLNTSLSFSKDEIVQQLHESPEKFSPNVILRPLYQSLLLPDLATVGGPSEVVYWMQLKSLFDFYKVNFPALLPRNFSLIFNSGQKNKLEKSGLHITDLFKDQNQIKKQILQNIEQSPIDFKEEATLINELKNRLVFKAEQVDSSLIASVGAEVNKITKIVDDIEKRLIKSLEKKNDVAINQVFNIKSKLFPNDNLQERVENYLNYDINNPNFINELKDVLNPFDFSFNIIEI